MLIQIKSNFFTAGLECKGNKVVRTAPIIKYMKGWDIYKVISYCKIKKYTMTILKRKEKEGGINGKR